MFRRAAVVCLTLALCALALPAGSSAAVVVEPVASVVVTADTSPIVVGDVRQFTATAYFVNGGNADVTPDASWTSTVPLVASVDSSGLALANSPGNTSIQAVYGGRTGRLRLTVSKCTILGTENGEVINGTAGPDHICGLGGDDEIHGLEGNDTLDGGAGADSLDGAAGVDKLLGGTENDLLYGGDDADFIYGGAGDDEADGGAGSDQLYGEAGGDTLLGGDDADRLIGGAGSDLLDGMGGADRLMPGEDDDLVAGGDQRDVVDYSDVAGPVVIDLPNGSATGAGTDLWNASTVEDATGSAADDHITALDAGSTLTGLAGIDQLLGGAGPDVLKGGTGNDSLNGGGGADSLFGDANDDSLLGEGGNDRLNGGDGDDALGGGDDDDTLYGEAGSDQFFGGNGLDKLFPGADDDLNVDGGAGDDTVVYDGAPSGVTVDLTKGTATGGSGNDTLADIERVTGTQHDDFITGDGFPNIILGLGGADTVSAEGSDDRVYGGAGADLLNGGDDADYVLGEGDGDTLHGDAGNDSLNGGAADDTIEGGGDNDNLAGGAGVDSLAGGPGNDTLNPGVGAESSLDGGDGDDTIGYDTNFAGVTIDLDAETATGSSGNDSFTSVENAYGTGSDDTIFGDENANRLSGKGGVDTIDGRGGVDTIFGGNGNDFLRGGSADVDSVDGQGGSDTCGEGPDTKVSCELSFNVAPTLTIVDNTNTFTEGDAAKAVDGTLTLTDDETNTESATVTIGAGFESGKDLLSVSGALPGGVTASYAAPTLTISGPATVAQYQTMLRNVRFENTSQDPSTANRTVTFAVFDGEDSDSGDDVTMAVLGVNDAPVASPDSYSGGNHGIRLRVGTTHADAHEVELSGNVLDGDLDADTPTGNLTTTPGTITSTDCAAASPACANNVNMASDGTFTYDPPAGGDSSDTFQYTVEDNDTGDSDGTEDTHTNTVTIGMGGTRAWFVDDSAPAGGRGVSHSPLRSLDRLTDGADLDQEDGADDRIFVYSGTYTDGIVLENGQKVLGEPEGLSIGETQFVAAGGTRPAMSDTTGKQVVVFRQGNELQDLTLGSTTGNSPTLDGFGGGSAYIRDVSINNAGNGRALQFLSSFTFDAVIDSLTSTNSNFRPVWLTDSAGTLTINGGAISNATGEDFYVQRGNAAITYAGTITDGTGNLVNIESTTGGTRTFSGAISDTVDNDNAGNGVRISAAAGTNSFTGGLSLSTGSSSAVDIANSPGATTVSGAGNTLKTTTGSALRVVNSALGAGGLTFQRIDSTTATTANPGILLDTVTGAGGLTVTGTGSAGTGGSILNKGTGIKLNGTKGPSLSWMKLSNHGDFAIKGDTVTGFTMANTVVDGSVGRNGDDANANEGAISFDELSGSASITSSVIKEGVSNDLRVRNDSGTLNRLTVTNTTFGSTQTTHNDAIQLENNGSGSLNATIGGGAGLGNTFTSARGDHFQASIQGVGVGDIVFTHNTLTNSHPTSLGGQVVLGSSGSGDMTYAVNDNTINGAIGTAIVAVATFASGMGDSTAAGTISGNQIGTSGVAGSGSSAGSGIDVSVIGNGRHSTTIANNTIRQQNQHGILAIAGGASRDVTGLTHTGALNVTATSNVVDQPHNTGSSSSGIQFIAGTNSGPSSNLPDQYVTCLNLLGNNLANAGEELSSNSRDYLIRARYETIIRLPGYTGAQTGNSATITSAITSYLTGRETGGFSVFADQDANDYVSGTVNDGYFNTSGGAPCPTA